jgi:single-strand DNA-binding protein
MEDLNTVAITGRVTRDAQARFTNSGTATLTVSIANNRRRKVNDTWQDDTSFFDIQMWGKMAESLAPKLTKGTQLSVQGTLRQDRWEQDGQSRARVVIVVEKVVLASKGENYGGF